ncbi:MAG: hypothetical protein LBR64_08440 [Dysgonamonadaceae bacterium]|jgi:hypothetical protein|nr:hypothetical protein [Dysgonamonadaceae bacterium]
MKNLIYFALLAIAGLTASCSESYEETSWINLNQPVFMSETEFRNSVKVRTSGEQITNLGKICFYNGYLFISETEKGIHVINNTNPSQPKNVAFIELLGNADISVRNNILYADSYIDLVWFDISSPEKPVLKGRLENVFPDAAPSCDNTYGIDYTACYDANGKLPGVIVGWEVKKIKSTNNDAFYEYLMDDGSYAMNASGGDKSGGSGVNGSMSRFAIYKDYLYAVFNYQMHIFDLKAEKPAEIPDFFYVGNVETIFSYKENMFLGTPTGMVIYSVANPEQPDYCSQITHVYGCDPVVVDNDVAFVTVRSGNFCGQTVDELIIIDVADVQHPKPLCSYSMTNPKGLGIDNGTLFLCDDGLKVFDARNPMTLMANQLLHKKGMDGYDLIPFGNTLMMIADDGLYQYDYSNLQNIKQISYIPIKE